MFVEKIGEQIMTPIGENGLRVKLHALDGQALVPHAHDFPVVCPRGYFEAVGHAFALDHQRMISRCTEGVGHAAEHTHTGVLDIGSLTVHYPLGMNDPAAERLADALLAGLDAE